MRFREFPIPSLSIGVSLLGGCASPIAGDWVGSSTGWTGDETYATPLIHSCADSVANENNADTYFGMQIKASLIGEATEGYCADGDFTTQVYSDSLVATEVAARTFDIAFDSGNLWDFAPGMECTITEAGLRCTPFYEDGSLSEDFVDFVRK